MRPLGATYAAPTAMMLMNLVWGRAGTNVPLDLVWQAILGVTDQYQRAHISDEYYGEVCAHLRVRTSGLDWTTCNSFNIPDTTNQFFPLCLL